MEVIGLVVIVIMITIGMLTLATFAFKSGSQKKFYQERPCSYSAMSAVMKSTVSGEAECFAQNGYGAGDS